MLVGTDVAARGLDVDDVDVVIHTSCNQLDSFVHRSGRTARKGKDGLNILFHDPKDLRTILDFERKLNIDIEVMGHIDCLLREGMDISEDESNSPLGEFARLLDRDANESRGSISG